jgi:carbon monoxide dehydrogenase subunit G
MDMIGEQFIALPQQRVWEALNDPQVLKDCIPGCETMEKVSDTEYRVVLSASVGPVKARFNGKLLLSDLDPPNAYALNFEGSGGAAGFGKGDCKVNLSPAEGGTRLAYAAHATIGGKLAQVGSRLIDGVARKMADDFFVKFNERVVPVAQPTPRAPASGTKPRIPVWAWVVGIIVLVLLALFVAKSTGGH